MYARGARMAPKHDPPHAEALGARIARLRAERKWTQLDLAERVGVAIQGSGNTASSRSIHAWEHNESTPSPRMRIELAKAFGVSVDYLLTGVDTGAGPPPVGADERLDHVEEQLGRLARSIARLEAPDRRQGNRMRDEGRISNEVSELREALREQTLAIAQMQSQMRDLERAQAAAGERSRGSGERPEEDQP